MMSPIGYMMVSKSSVNSLLIGIDVNTKNHSIEVNPTQLDLVETTWDEHGIKGWTLAQRDEP